MSNDTREPLTPKERKGFWRSLWWAFATIAVWPLGAVWVTVGPQLAQQLGLKDQLSLLYHDELTAVPCFLAFQACLAISIMNGWPARLKRPICLLWMFGPLLLFCAWPFIVVILVRFSVI